MLHDRETAVRVAGLPFGTMHAAVILNQEAGTLAQVGNGSAWSVDDLRRAFADAGVAADFRLCPGCGVQDIVRTMAGRNGTDAIVIGGGDGTISCAAGVLADTGIPVAVLPLGTLNHFAKDLGMPADMEGCIRVLAQARPRPVDLAEVNGRIFINNCSIGAYPAAVRRRDALRRLHGFSKWRAMVVASLRVLRELRRLHVQIATTQEVRVRRTPFVVVANNRYAGHILSRQLRPRLDEGMLCAYVTRAHRVAPLLRLVWRAIFSGIDAVDELETCEAGALTVSLQETAPAIATDGEIFQVTSPLRFRIRPAALQVIAPATGTP